MISTPWSLVSTPGDALRFVGASIVCLCVFAEGGLAGENHATLQAAIDAQPGMIVQIPQGEHRIDQPLRITKDGTGLSGYGTIVQTNPDAPILIIEGADGVRVESVTLQRAESDEPTRQDGVRCQNCRSLRLSRVRVLDNKSIGAAIRLTDVDRATVEECEISNYKAVGVDDRTSSELNGYAFHCIDGHGIHVSNAIACILRNNRIVEYDLLPTRETRDQFRLGKLTEGRLPTRLGELGQRAVRDQQVNNWHQGSAMLVTGPRDTRHTLITGNYIENAGQGVDLHCDHVVCSNNVIDKAVIGLKATHGCRNLLLSGNLLTRIDLWGIVLNPGAGSHHASAASGDEPARPANVDAGIVISQNVIADYGEGYDYWYWGGAHDDRGSSYAIALLEPQLATCPPLRDVLIQGNMVYDATRDQSDAQESAAPNPKYRYAVFIEQGDPAPEGIRFFGNLFHPGKSGVSNVPLDLP